MSEVSCDYRHSDIIVNIYTYLNIYLYDLLNKLCDEGQIQGLTTHFHNLF